MRFIAIVLMVITVAFATSAMQPHQLTTRSDQLKNNQVPKRSNIDKEKSWKLEDLFAAQREWDQEHSLVKKRLPSITQYQGKLNNPKDLLECLTLEDDLSLHTERLFVYANMKHHEDTTNPTYQSLADKSKKLSVEVGETFSFITPEILSMPNDKLKECIEHPDLSSYKRTLEEMQREKAHVLSKAEEGLLAQVGSMAQAPGTIFSMLNNADLKFPTIKNEKGEEIELTQGRYIQFLESSNRDVRREAFQAMYKTYSKQKNTISATLNANITKNIFYSKARKYPSVLEMSLYKDNIPKEVYTNLIDTIHQHLPLLHRYMALRKKLLKLDELHMYDLFAPLVEEFEMEISYDEAKKRVKDSLKPLGDEYLDILQTGYNEGWIDVYENEGKRSGAYSWGAYGTHPYVMLNHKDNLNSMFTLTHEMGHAIHSYLSDRSLPYRDAQYTIFLAEVASTLNEALLMDHMLNHTSNLKEKMYLLTYYADQFRTTVFRQTMFAEFEKIVHEQTEQGESLTPQDLSKIYYDLNVKYHGPQMIVDQDIEMEWARIPHFYTSFYVYKYATGFSAATSFSKQIKDEGQPAVDRFLSFLKSGGSDYSINLLQQAGVDMSSPKPIRQAMEVFENLIEEMEQLTS